MTVYIDTEDLKATLGVAGTDFLDDDLDRAAAAASGMVDSICGRTFGLGDTGETRYFIPDDPRFLRIDDLVSASSVSIDRDLDGTYEETLTVGTDVRLGPPNASVMNQPYTFLEALTGVSLSTTGGYVKIVGQWGWPTVPVEVVQAAGILASRLLRRSREAPFAIVMTADAGSARIGRVDPEVRALLSRYVISPSIASPRLG